jgi:hypothetical protein
MQEARFYGFSLEHHVPNVTCCGGSTVSSTCPKFGRIWRRLRISDFFCRKSSWVQTLDNSFWTRATAFLNYRTLHKQYRERDRKGQHGHHPKGVEIGKRRCLLLAQILECLPGQLLRSHRIAGLLQERSPSLLEERSYGRIERIEGLAKPQGVKLITPLLDGLGQRRPDTAPLIAQEAQQANRSPAQRQRRIEVGAYVRGSKTYRQSATTSTRGQTAWPGLMSRLSCDIQ